MRKKLLKNFPLLLVLVGASVGLIQSYTLDQTQLTQRTKTLLNLTHSFQSLQKAKAASDSQLKQEQSQAAQLKAQINSLTAQLQSKAAQAQKVATASVGYGGDFTGGFGGRINGYAPGNCTAFVASLLPVPDGWGNASNWARAAQAAGYTVSDAPRINAIAQTGAGYFGHVGIVEAIQNGIVEIKEANVEGWGVVDERWVSVSDYQYIYF